MMKPIWPGRLGWRRAGVNTYLPQEGSIASGATDFFLVGKRRVVEEGEEVGMHSWPM